MKIAIVVKILALEGGDPKCEFCSPGGCGNPHSFMGFDSLAGCQRMLVRLTSGGFDSRGGH